MPGRDGLGNAVTPSARKRDRDINDALATMERLATWLQDARERNAWAETEDALQTVMLHGLLTHLRNEIDSLLALGADDAAAALAQLRGAASDARGER